MKDYVNHLLACRASHLQAISLIDQLLAKAETPTTPVSPPPLAEDVGALSLSAGRATLPRRRNALSKTVLLRKILEEAQRPLKLHEILKEMLQRGYQFNSVYPKGTLNPLLYGQARLEFVSRTPTGFVFKGREKEFDAGEPEPTPRQT